MRRIAFAALSSFLFASLLIFASPAKAGGYYGGGYGHHGYYGRPYYGGGYYHHGYPHVWYSSHCCFRKIVRHERSVFFERLYEPYYHHGYYGAPYYGGYGPRYHVGYAYPPYGGYGY